jgi:hypothetical protein
MTGGLSLQLAVLLLPLLPFQLFPQSLGFLANALDSFHPLPLLIHVAALHNPLHDLPCVDPGEVVSANFLIDAHSLWRRVRVIRQGHKARRAVIDSIRKAVGTRGQVCASGSEGGSEDHSVYVLLNVRRASIVRGKVLTLHWRTQRPRS